MSNCFPGRAAPQAVAAHWALRIGAWASGALGGAAALGGGPRSRCAVHRARSQSTHLERKADLIAPHVEDRAVGSGAQAPHDAQGLKDFLRRGVGTGGSVLGQRHAAAQMTPLEGAS